MLEQRTQSVRKKKHFQMYGSLPQYFAAEAPASLADSAMQRLAKSYRPKFHKDFKSFSKPFTSILKDFCNLLKYL